MKAALEITTNVLLACACVVVIGVGTLEFRNLSRSPAAPAGAMAGPGFESIKDLEISIADMHLKGSRNAPVVMIEFSDFQCPFCGQYAAGTFKQIEHEFVDTGKVAYVSADFPLTTIHPFALKAAEAAGCAGAQGKYWDMFGRLFEHQNQLAEGDLLTHAGSIGLDETQFTQCMNVTVSQALLREEHEAKKAGINSTPIFLIGHFATPSTVAILRRVTGVKPYSVFQNALADVSTNRNAS
jgi:protein-disulfide isomerase